MRTTIQGVVSGIHWGLGFGLGAMLGGLLYAGLGASRCFAVSAALPSLSLLLLVLPTARRWVSGADARGGRAVAKGMPPRSRRRCWGGCCCGGGGDDGRSSYELVAKVGKGTLKVSLVAHGAIFRSRFCCKIGSGGKEGCWPCNDVNGACSSAPRKGCGGRSFKTIFYSSFVAKGRR